MSQTSTSPNSNTPRGAVGGGGSQGHTPVEANDNLFSHAYARVLDVVSEGEILGLCNQSGYPITDITQLGQGVYYNGTPVLNPDGSANFAGVRVGQVTGTQDQPVIQGFAQASDTVMVQAQIKVSVPQVFTISDSDTDRVLVGVRVPSLYYQVPGSDKDHAGDITGTAVTLQIYVALNGGTSTLYETFTISGKSSGEYIVEKEITLPKSDSPATDSWQLRVVRVTGDSTSLSTSNQTWMHYYTRCTDACYAYPNTAIIATQLDSANFSSIPSRTFHIKGVIIQVPSNYFPATRTYTRRASDGSDTGVNQIWDGTFYMAWSNNPAWVLYDLLTNVRYGIGEFMAPYIDKWQLYQIGQYCDEMIDDGYGLSEPRFTCNVLCDTQQQVLNLISSFASVFQGMLYWGGGTLRFTQDRPYRYFNPTETPKMVFTNANVLEGQFTYATSGLRQRHTAVIVEWKDPSDQWNPKFEWVQDDTAVNTYGVNQMTATAFGVTSRGQARRVGRWLLLSELYRTTLCTFTAGLEGAYPEPGDVVAIADRMKNGARCGGRVLAISADRLTVTVDAPVAVTTGDTFTVVSPTAWLQTGDVTDSTTIESINAPQTTQTTVTNPRGTTAVFTLATALPASVTNGSVWALSDSVAPVALRTVLAVVEKAQNNFEFTTMDYSDAVFSYAESNPAFIEPVITNIPVNTKLPTPNNLTGTPVVYQINKQAVQAIKLQWERAPSKSVKKYAVWRQRDDGGGWRLVSEQTDTYFEFRYVKTGNYSFEVCSVDANGTYSAPATLTVYADPVAAFTSYTVTGLEIVNNGTGQGNDTTFNTKSVSFQWRLNNPLGAEEIGSETNGASGGATPDFLKDYQVTILDPITEAIKYTAYVKQESFTFTEALNISVFKNTPSSNFYICVRARSVVNTLSIPAQILATAVTCDAPTNFASTDSSSLVTLTWTDPVAGTFKNVEVWESKTDDVTTASKVATAAPGAQKHILAGRKLNVTYYYWLRAIDAYGYPSAWTSGTTSGLTAGPTSQIGGGSTYLDENGLTQVGVINGSTSNIGLGAVDTNVHKIQCETAPTIPDSNGKSWVYLNNTAPTALYTDTPGSYIYYTKDGSNPTTSGTRVKCNNGDLINFTSNATTTFQACGYKFGYTSTVHTFYVKMSSSNAESPLICTMGGQYGGAIKAGTAIAVYWPFVSPLLSTVTITARKFTDTPGTGTPVSFSVINDGGATSSSGGSFAEISFQAVAAITPVMPIDDTDYTVYDVQWPAITGITTQPTSASGFFLVYPASS